MRNLKKVLSLVLALAMVLSLCMVGAGAVNYDDFTDEGTITKKQAVETLVSLDVIKGYNDGATFNPTGNVTRAEMATMICRILAGGDNMIVDATKPVATYADIDGHWAESYIEYCSSLGIVSGKSPTSFDPDANVTAAEAAKMVMTTLGYNADIEGFKGIGWDINTMAKANTLMLLDNLQGEISSSVPVTREQVAQMLFNALDDPMVQNYVGTSANLWIGSGANAYQQTLLESKFNAQKVVGVVEANEFADLYDTDPLGRGKTRIMVLGTDNMPTNQKYTLNLSTSLDQIGESIIVYRDTTSNRILFGNDQASDMNVVNEYTSKGDITKGGDFENAISKDALTKNTEYFVNYDVNDVTKADIRIRYVVDLDKLDADSNLKEDLQAAAAKNDGSISGNTYSKVIRDGATLTQLDIRAIVSIFNEADTKIDNEGEETEKVVYDLGAVYVGTQSNKDISDEIDYDKFEDQYLVIEQDLSKVTENENGNYIKTVDYNNDGEVDFVLKTIYTATEVTKVAKDGKVTLATEDYALTDRKDGFEVLNQLDDRTDVVSDDELAKGDVVLYTVIDGTAYAYLADSVTADIDKVNRNTLTATTVDGDEYVESGVHNHTYNDLYEDGVRNLGGKISYDLYFDRYGYVVLFTENVSSSFTLITDGWYNEIKSNKDIEYAVEAWVDGKLQVVDVTKGGDLFITGDYVDNNGWGALKKFGGLVNKYDANGTLIVDASDSRNAHTDLNFDTIDINDADQTEANNIWTTVADLNSNGVLTPVGNVYTKREVRMIDLDTNTDILSSSRITEGYLYDSNTRGDAYTQTTVSNTNLDPAAPVEIRAVSTTVYYYVWDNGKTPIVREYVGYGNTPKLSSADVVEDVYAVATKATRDSDETRPDTYYTANVVVVEFASPYKTSAEIVFVYDAPVVSGRVGTEELNVIKPDGSLGTILADLSNLRDYSPALGKAVDPGLFRIWETNKERDGEKIYEIEPLTAEDIAKEKFVIGTVNTEKVVGDIDWVGLTTWNKNGPDKDTTVGINKNDVKDADNIKTYFGLTNEDPDVEKRNTENSKYYTLSIKDDGTGWSSGYDRYKVDLGGERDALDREEVLMEHVREGRYTDLLNTVLVSYDKDNKIVYAISFAHLDGTARNQAQNIWASMLTNYVADDSITIPEAIQGLKEYVQLAATTDPADFTEADDEIVAKHAAWRNRLEDALANDEDMKPSETSDALALVGAGRDSEDDSDNDGLVKAAEIVIAREGDVDTYIQQIKDYLGIVDDEPAPAPVSALRIPALGVGEDPVPVVDPFETLANDLKAAIRAELTGVITEVDEELTIASTPTADEVEAAVDVLIKAPADLEAANAVLGWTGTETHALVVAGCEVVAEDATFDADALLTALKNVYTKVEVGTDAEKAEGTGLHAAAILELFKPTRNDEDEVTSVAILEIADLTADGALPETADGPVDTTDGDVGAALAGAVDTAKDEQTSATKWTVKVAANAMSAADGATFYTDNENGNQVKIDKAASTFSGDVGTSFTITAVATKAGTFTLIATPAEGTPVEKSVTFEAAGEDTIVFDGLTAGEWTLTFKAPVTYHGVSITSLDGAESMVINGDTCNTTTGLDRVASGTEVTISLSTADAKTNVITAVTDSGSSSVTVTDEDEDGTWTFTMPDNDVVLSITVKSLAEIAVEEAKAEVAALVDAAKAVFASDETSPADDAKTAIDTAKTTADSEIDAADGDQDAIDAAVTKAENAIKAALVTAVTTKLTATEADGAYTADITVAEATATEDGIKTAVEDKWSSVGWTAVAGTITDIDDGQDAAADTWSVEILTKASEGTAIVTITFTVDVTT